VLREKKETKENIFIGNILNIHLLVFPIDIEEQKRVQGQEYCMNRQTDRE
jgi:hypothetical protein